MYHDVALRVLLLSGMQISHFGTFEALDQAYTQHLRFALSEDQNTVGVVGPIISENAFLSTKSGPENGFVQEMRPIILSSSLCYITLPSFPSYFLSSSDSPQLSPIRRPWQILSIRHL